MVYSLKLIPIVAGLGLSIVYNLISQAVAKMELTSTIGKGATFKITLPFKTESDISMA